MPVSATQEATELVVREQGLAGLAGVDGTDGVGIQTVRMSKINNPLCHLFKANKLTETLSGALTWTRSTTATYVDRYGVAQTAAIDTPREESEGWLIEGASTNLLTYSEDFSNAAWAKSFITVTTNSDIAPDGTLTADDLADLDAANTSFVSQTTLSITNDSLTKTASCFFKAGTSANFQIEFRLSGGTAVTSILYLQTSDMTSSGGSNDGFAIKALANGWYRVSINALNNNSGNTIGRLLIRPATLAAGLDVSLTGSVKAWGAQIEELPFASSHISTTTASATRTADSVSVTVDRNFLSSVQGDHSQSFSFTLLGDTTTSQRLYTTRSLSSSNSRFYAISATGTGSISYRDGSLVNASTPVNTLGDEHQLSLVTKNGLMTTYSDGVAGSIDILISPDDDINTAETLNFGSDDAGGLPMYGYLSDFRIYDFALNAAEVGFLS